jgi:dienelactone hydrolase
MSARRKIIVVAAIPVVIASLAITTSYEYVRGAAFVIQAAGMNGTARSLAEWHAVAVTEADATIPVRDGSLRARTYRAATTSGPPVLVVPGVHAGGIDEPRLVTFARDVASMGHHVLTAELPDLKAYAITPRTTDHIEDAARWLAHDSGLAADGRIGLMGISFAGGLSLVAATRPTLRDRVAFVMSFGGHGDLPRTLRYLCTGEVPGGGSRPPHDYGVAIILLGVADRVVPAEQAAPLRDAIRAFLNASHVAMVDEAQAAIAFERARAMAERLPEPARTLMGYVNDRDVAQLGPLLLPHTTDLGGHPALSPSKADTPTFPVYLLHGTDDNVIPAVESELLAETLRSAGADVTQLATPLITHAEVDREPGAGAVWELVRFWAKLLDES